MKFNERKKKDIVHESSRGNEYIESSRYDC